jgi:hypothetical protein
MLVPTFNRAASGPPSSRWQHHPATPREGEGVVESLWVVNAECNQVET